MIVTVLAFLVTIAVLVVIHEYGHYRVALACNVKVLRFSVGFGRVLWRRQKGPDATEFVVCALPLGGYVRMLDEREAPVDSTELHRAFNRKPLAQRAAIVSAGPAANLLLAVVLYAAAHWIGVQEPQAVLGAPPAGTLAERAGLQSGDRVVSLQRGDGDWADIGSAADLRWEVMQAALDREALQLRVAGAGRSATRTLVLDFADADSAAGEVDAGFVRRIGLGNLYSEPVLGAIQPDGPAAKAGLAERDRVLAVDGVAVVDAAGLRERIRAGVRDGRPVEQQWSIERDGRPLTIAVVPRAVAGEDGTTVGRIDAYVGAPPAMVTVGHGPVEGLVQGVARTWDVAKLTVGMLGRMLVGDASLKNLSGPITIADYAGQTAQLGFAYYLGFLALVSVSLGVLNLLPLPMLDGGHLMYYIFEGVTGRPVSDRWLARLQRGGIAVLLLMMSVALFNDFARLFGLH